MIKKSIAMMVVLIMLGLLLACTGPAGPPGPAGPTGPVGSAGAPGKSAVSPTPSIVITPASGVGKTPIKVLGAGFQPGENIQVILDIGGTLHSLGARNVDPPVADQYGTFKADSLIPHPNVCAPGVHIMTVTGDKGSEAIFPLGVTE